jgi:hypothetical protein
MMKMPENSKIPEIIKFVTKHPESTAGRRICREILGQAVERFNEEFAMELETGLKRHDDNQINTYYSLVR